MKFISIAMVVAILGLALSASAQEAEIRKTLIERIPRMGAIDEIQKTPMQGLYEVRIGNDLMYTDAKGDFLLYKGDLIDTKERRNVTQERMEKILSIDFSALPLQDSITIVRGNGKRKMAIFEDPNCLFCKRFEKDIKGINDVTIYLFLYPILGPDSVQKSRNIWCSSERAQAWHEIMLNNSPAVANTCDTSAIDRNVSLGKKNKINGTPTTILSNGKRVSGAVLGQELEKWLSEVLAGSALTR